MRSQETCRSVFHFLARRGCVRHAQRGAPTSTLRLLAFCWIAIPLAMLGCGPAQKPVAKFEPASDSDANSSTSPPHSVKNPSEATQSDASGEAPQKTGGDANAASQAASQGASKNAATETNDVPGASSSGKAPAEPSSQPSIDDLAADGPPFPYRARVPPPEFPENMEWLNTDKPLKLSELKGKFVLLDFWTYCCINCMHILPELKKLEHKYPNQLVVIGVHSAKFDTEKETNNIREAILRYEIEHPVVNDNQMAIWDSYYIRSWPSMRLIDPEGNMVWGTGGEIKVEELSEVMERGLPYYRQRKSLSEKPFTLQRERLAAESPLRFPGKILADEAGGRLFISDSNHNRIVVSSLSGELLQTIGSGEVGRADGEFAVASFNHPQGLALRGDTLYVADTEGHLLRKVDLKNRDVSTIAGVGTQAKYPWPGIENLPPGAGEADLPERWIGPPRTTSLNSPWALWIHQNDLFIAMAGPHQIWKMPLDLSEIGPYAGNGREDIVDGPLLPRIPFEVGYSSFAQPSGLTSDGTSLFVADSEGSSIRAVPFDPAAEVRTVVGTSHLGGGRLFAFGDVDGPAEKARLQHALDVVFANGRLYVADTYNNKIKEVDPQTGETKTLVGTGKSGHDDASPTFDEPAGLAFAKGKLYVADTNSHRIRVIDLANGNKVSTLSIAGLTPPANVKKP